jgi:hypothetical protein
MNFACHGAVSCLSTIVQGGVYGQVLFAIASGLPRRGGPFCFSLAEEWLYAFCNQHDRLRVALRHKEHWSVSNGINIELWRSEYRRQGQADA